MPGVQRRPQGQSRSRLGLGLFIALLLLGHRPVARAAAFTVTTTADSGPGSLRQAILDANANPGLDTITFAIGAPGSQQTIQPTTALPSITSPSSSTAGARAAAATAARP